MSIADTRGPRLSSGLIARSSIRPSVKLSSWQAGVSKKYRGYCPSDSITAMACRWLLSTALLGMAKAAAMAPVKRTMHKRKTAQHRPKFRKYCFIACPLRYLSCNSARRFMRISYICRSFFTTTSKMTPTRKESREQVPNTPDTTRVGTRSTSPVRR